MITIKRDDRGDSSLELGIRNNKGDVVGVVSIHGVRGRIDNNYLLRISEEIQRIKIPTGAEPSVGVSESAELNVQAREGGPKGSFCVYGADDNKVAEFAVKVYTPTGERDLEDEILDLVADKLDDPGPLRPESRAMVRQAELDDLVTAHVGLGPDYRSVVVSNSGGDVVARVFVVFSNERGVENFESGPRFEKLLVEQLVAQINAAARDGEKTEPGFPESVKISEVVRLRPGDRVVLKTSRMITMAEAAAVKLHANRIFPDHEVLLLADNIGIEIMRDEPGSPIDTSSLEGGPSSIDPLTPSDAASATGRRTSPGSGDRGNAAHGGGGTPRRPLSGEG